MKGNRYLDYYKTVLEKVSFSDLLLAKEYAKAKKSLNERDLEQLWNWMLQNGMVSRLQMENQLM